MDMVWAHAHPGIEQKVVDERKAKGKCTRYTLANQGGKHGQEEIGVCYGGNNILRTSKYTRPDGW